MTKENRKSAQQWPRSQTGQLAWQKHQVCLGLSLWVLLLPPAEPTPRSQPQWRGGFLWGGGGFKHYPLLIRQSQIGVLAARIRGSGGIHHGELDRRNTKFRRRQRCIRSSAQNCCECSPLLIGVDS